MPYCVYAIYNEKHDRIYIGQTEDLEDRLRLHNGKQFKGSYTARFDGEWKLIYREECITRQEALEKEKKLKHYRGRKFIRNIISLKQ